MVIFLNTFKTIQQLYPTQPLCSQGIYCLSGFEDKKMKTGTLRELFHMLCTEVQHMTPEKSIKELPCMSKEGAVSFGLEIT